MKIFLVLLLLTGFATDAAKVDTNQSMALVDPNTQTQWQQQQQGLIAVLSKKSGLSRAVLAQEYVIDERFKSAILRTYFERLPAAVQSDQQWFNITVNEQAFQQLMIDQRIPIWPDRRGQVKVWVVTEKMGQELQFANQDSMVIYWLRKWFQATGIPVNFYDPLKDELLNFKPEDVRYVNPDLVDSILSEEDISTALLVFVNDSGNGYAYRYGLAKSGERTIMKNLQFIDLSMGMAALVEDVQKANAENQRLYAEEFNQNTVSMTVNDILTADQALQLIDYLDEHALIANYQINQSKGQQFQITAVIKVLPETFVAFVDNEKILTHQPIGVGSNMLFKMNQ